MTHVNDGSQNKKKGKALPPAWQKLLPYVKSLLFLVGFVLFFSIFAVPMGLGNALNTLMNTGYRILMETVFYIMAIAVLAGAVSSLLTEFGVVALLNKLLSPLMGPLFGMPGASALGMISTYLSDNPAILTLADDKKFRRYFKAYQIPALTNLGTAFGMGLIVTSFVLGMEPAMGKEVGLSALCGNLGAVIGGIVSTRLMLVFMKKVYGKEQQALSDGEFFEEEIVEKEKPKGFLRIMNALMEGGKRGVELGLAIIPGVLIICSLVFMLTKGPGEGGAYTGAAYEGIALLPKAADKIGFILNPLFGFSNGEAIAVPVTALGSAGAALGMIPKLSADGLIGCNDLAVFTAICMCWSGYLSTHVSMMQVLGEHKHTGKAILSHTLGGLVAGVAAHWLFVLMSTL